MEGLAFGGVKVPFVYDIAAHGRFLLAVPVLVLADTPIGVRLRQVVTHFIAAHLIRENEKARFRDALIDALRLRDSRIAELTILVLAYLATYNATEGSFQGSTWYRLEPGHELTLVGYWFALVSLPIFQFLIFAGYTV